MRRRPLMRLRYVCLAVGLSGVILGCKDDRFVPMELFFGSTASAAQPVSGRKPVIGEYAAGIPPVLLTAEHAALCKLKVGDPFPALELPKLEGGNAKLESLAGKKATVVIIWSPEGWMNRVALADIAKDVTQQEIAAGAAVIGVAVGQAEAVQAAATKAGAKFPQLVDADGAAFGQVGSGSLPRIFVLDSQRRIAWFDIEYSEATRRELRQTLNALSTAR